MKLWIVHCDPQPKDANTAPRRWAQIVANTHKPTSARTHYALERLPKRTRDQQAPRSLSTEQFYCQLPQPTPVHFIIDAPLPSSPTEEQLALFRFLFDLHPCIGLTVKKEFPLLLSKGSLINRRKSFKVPQLKYLPI
ncbi:unnamed protein product [Toxocara canis]|uniref:Uncharacterized protein n=1 Tax=Toxocara canis TaxID=6265 RepID=A0A183UBM1_TOXCA|nr:unnamed protein product [Toxocara canis]